MTLVGDRIKLQAIVEGEPLDRSRFQIQTARDAAQTSISVPFAGVTGLFCFRVYRDESTTGDEVKYAPQRARTPAVSVV